MAKESSSIGEGLMLDTRDVARLLKCSGRHVANLRKAGFMPLPVKLGASVRWPRRVIEEWIAAGCPPKAVQRAVLALIDK